MSAFLYYSQGRRQLLKDQNPDLKNTEVSRLLGEHWRNAREEERRPFVEKEKIEREKYKVAIAEWRKDYEKKKEAQKKQQAAQMEQQARWPMPAYPPPDGVDQPVQHSAMAYQHPPPYGMPPPAHYGHNYPHPTPPHYYGPGPPRGYPYQGPYNFPTNGKQPVILGPNGMPHYTNAPPQAAGYQPPLAAPPPDYDDPQEPLPAGGPQSFDYVADQITEPQIAR